ncbi:MAG: bifunctional tetrahydrofolate synthase/dihydrofolate synthase [Methylococcales bacterium]
MRFNSLSEWLNWQESFHPKTIDLGLDRARKTFREVLHDRVLPFTITVGGTNGKGSCVALLETMLGIEGYRVGSYTSPHILQYNERIRVNGNPVEDDAICQSFDRIDNARGNVSLSYFEFSTLAALDIFSRCRLDVQILEVGLGGRLDAVNIVDPDSVIISSIGIDHIDWLGQDREMIGFEKAGVFRPGVPAIIGDPNPPDSLLKSAEEQNTLLYQMGRDFSFQRDESSWSWYGHTRSRKNLPIPALHGEHQFFNASAVLQTLDVIQNERPVLDNAIRQGLSKVSLPGRFQWIPGEPSIVLDVAHNPQAAVALANSLEEFVVDRQIHAVFSVMGDKDIKGIVNPMKSIITHWYIAPLPTPRGADPACIVQAIVDCKIERSKATIYGEFREALSAAKTASGKDSLVVVFGSFFQISEYVAIDDSGVV